MSIYYWLCCNGFSTIFPFYTNTTVGFINKLSYSVIFIKKINLSHLRYWCFPGKCINFFWSNHQNCFMKKGVLKDFCNIHRKVAELQPYQEETPTRMFSSEYCKIFKNTDFEEHLLKAASDFSKQQQNSSEQLLLYSLLF